MPDEVLLAFDFGLRRIGVAIGNTISQRARPLTTIDVIDNRQRFSRIAELLEIWQPTRLVVGMPRTATGEEHEFSARCLRFGNQLSGRFQLPVEYADERFSSASASEEMRASGLAEDSDMGIDAHAAAIILETWFARAENTICH